MPAPLRIGASAAPLAEVALVLLIVLGLRSVFGGRPRAPSPRRAAARAQDHAAGSAGAERPASDGKAGYRRFRLTQYWVAPLVLDTFGEELRDQDGRLITRVTPRSKRRLDMEGTGRLPDGRVLNVTGIQHRYRVLRSGVRGIGVQGRLLRPFFSVATDHGGRAWKDTRTRDGPLVPVGTRLYIRELDGLALPDGGVHDGWVTADDTGDAIYGAHLDLFVGLREHQLDLPEEVWVWFPGIEEIPLDYTYGLDPAPGPRGAYEKLRPPPPPRRVS